MESTFISYSIDTFQCVQPDWQCIPICNNTEYEVIYTIFYNIPMSALMWWGSCIGDIQYTVYVHIIVHAHTYVPASTYIREEEKVKRLLSTWSWYTKQWTRLIHSRSLPIHHLRPTKWSVSSWRELRCMCGLYTYTSELDCGVAAKSAKA